MPGKIRSVLEGKLVVNKNVKNGLSTSSVGKHVVIFGEKNLFKNGKSPNVNDALVVDVNEPTILRQFCGLQQAGCYKCGTWASRVYSAPVVDGVSHDNIS